MSFPLVLLNVTTVYASTPERTYSVYS